MSQDQPTSKITYVLMPLTDWEESEGKRGGVSNKRIVIKADKYSWGYGLERAGLGALYESHWFGCFRQLLPALHRDYPDLPMAQLVFNLSKRLAEVFGIDYDDNRAAGMSMLATPFGETDIDKALAMAGEALDKVFGANFFLAKNEPMIAAIFDRPVWETVSARRTEDVEVEVEVEGEPI